MRRKVIYLAMGVGIIAVIGTMRGYGNSLAKQKGYLGSEIIFYRESVSADSEGHKETIMQPAEIGRAHV